MLQKTRFICKGWCGWNVKTRICPIQCLETIWITLVVTVGIIWDPIECFEQMICSCVRFSVRPCCLKRIALECMYIDINMFKSSKCHSVPSGITIFTSTSIGIICRWGGDGGAWWPGGGKKPQQWWLFSLFAKQRGKESQDEHIFIYRRKKQIEVRSLVFFLVGVFFSIVRTSFLKHLVISWHVVCRLSEPREKSTRLVRNVLRA